MTHAGWLQPGLLAPLPTRLGCRVDGTRYGMGHVGRQAQVVRSDEIGIGHQEGALNHILEFTYVTRPGMLAHPGQRGVRQPCARAPCWRGVAFEKMPCEHINIAHPGSQRRNFERENANPKVQVFAKPAFAHRLFETAVGGGDQTKVERNFLMRPDAFHDAFLQDPQQFGLQFGRHLADLVQKQRAPVREFELPCLALLGAGKGTALIAKEGGFEQVFGDRGTVDRNKGPARALRVRMDITGEHFFARARLTAQQHREFAGSHAPQARQHLQKNRVLAHGTRGGGVGAVALDDFDQGLGLKGFEQELAGPALNGIYGSGHVGICGHQDEGHVGHLPAHGAQQSNAIKLRHPHVADDDRWRFGVQ